MKTNPKMPTEKKLDHLSQTEISRSEIFPLSSNKVYKNFLKKQAGELAFERYCDKSYQEEHRNKQLLAYVASLFIQLLGCVMAIFALHNLFYYLIPKFSYSEVLSLTLAAVLLVMLEVAKRILWSDLFSERYKKNIFSMGTLSISIVLFAISASSSTIGAYQLTTAMLDSTQRVSQESFKHTQLLENQYNTQIKQHQQKINQIEKEVANKIKEGYFLATPPAEEAKIKFYTQQIEKLQQERDKKTGKIEQSTLTQNTDIQKTAQRYAVAGFLVSALLEVLAIVCIAFLAYYDFRVYLEEKARQKYEGKQIIVQQHNTGNTGNFQDLLQQFLQWNQVAGQMRNALQVGEQELSMSPMNSASVGFKIPQQEKNTQKSTQISPKTKNLTFTNNYVEGKGYAIHCPNCGKKDYKKSPRAIYCSPACNKAYNSKAKK